MFARKSLFRGKLNRGIKISGEYGTTPSAGFINISEVRMIDKIGGQDISEAPYVIDGTSIQISTIADIKIVKDNIVMVKYHPELYRSGVVMGPSFLDVEDTGPINFTFEATQDINLKELPYIVRLYLEGH